VTAAASEVLEPSAAHFEDYLWNSGVGASSNALA
jgi:hypothetical protein